MLQDDMVRLLMLHINLTLLNILQYMKLRNFQLNYVYFV